MIGEVVGNFRITGQIAVGGMGVVYMAEHKLIGKKAAVKVLRREFSANRDVVERFFREAKLTSGIRHPGIIDVQDYGYHNDERAYIVMEFLEGETLKQRIQTRGVLPLESAVRIVRSVAGAVGAAHAQGITHRDLKPDNIFLVPDPEMPGGERVKVLDFGLAKLSESQDASIGTQVGIVLGTPTYMSPEQCDGVGQIDHRADQYALGCILYQLLTGRPPFASDSPMDLFKAHRYQAPEPPRNLVPLIPAELEKVILKLLSKSPEHRFPDMDRVRIALDNSLSPEPEFDTLVEEPDTPHLPPPPAAPPHQSMALPLPAPPPGFEPMSSLSGSNGQMISMMRSRAMTAPSMVAQNVSGAYRPPSGPMHTGSLMARPVRLPSVTGLARRRIRPVYWMLGAVASICIGVGMVYLVRSLSEDEPTVILSATEHGTEPGAGPATGPAAVGTEGTPVEPTATPALAAGADAGAGLDAGRAAGAPDAAAGAPGSDDGIEIEPDGVTAPGAAPAPGAAASPGTPGTPPAAPATPATATPSTPATAKPGTPPTAPSTPPPANPGTPPAAPGTPAASQPVALQLELVPVGAVVTVDGQVRSERPLRLVPRERPYRFVVTAPGHVRKEVSVRVDRAKSVRIQLERERGLDL